MNKVKLGLCCMTSTGKQYSTFRISSLEKLSQQDALEKVKSVYSHNVSKLNEHIDFCLKHNIQTFRVSSEIFPKLFWLFDFFNKKTREEFDLFIRVLEDKMDAIKLKVQEYKIMLSLHPSQFCVLSSPKPDVIDKAINILNEHFYLCDLLDIDEVNIHIGSGTYGDKESAIQRFIQNFERIPQEHKNKITLENDEFYFNIEDILFVCNKLGIRATFDIHHHRVHQLYDVLPLSEEEYFHLAKQTWEDCGYNYQRIHLSSPKESSVYERIISESGKETYLQSHHDFIDKDHFPTYLSGEVHIDIEAKAKEQAIFKLREDCKVRVL